MDFPDTIEVREVAAGWRVERCGCVLLDATSQDRAMITALGAASAAFEHGDRVQVVVAPLAGWLPQP